MQPRNTALLNQKLLDACVPSSYHRNQGTKGIRLTSLQELLPPEDQEEYTQPKVSRLPVQYTSPNKTTQQTISSTMTFMSPPKTVHYETKVPPRQIKIQALPQQQIRVQSTQMVMPVVEKPVHHLTKTQQQRVNSPTFRPITPLNQVLKIQQPRSVQSPKIEIISHQQFQRANQVVFSRSINNLKPSSPISPDTNYSSIINQQNIAQKKQNSVQRQNISASPSKVTNTAVPAINIRVVSPQKKQIVQNYYPSPSKLTKLEQIIPLSLSKTITQVPITHTAPQQKQIQQANVCTQTEQESKTLEKEHHKPISQQISRTSIEKYPSEDIIHRPARYHHGYRNQHQVSSIFSNNFLKEKKRQHEIPKKSRRREGREFRQVKKSSIGVQTNLHGRDIEQLEKAYEQYSQLSQRFQNQKSQYSYDAVIPQKNYEVPSCKYIPVDLIKQTKSNSKTSILSPLDLSELMKQEEREQTLGDEDTLSIRQLRMQRILKKYRSQDNFYDFRI